MGKIKKIIIWIYMINALFYLGYKFLDTGGRFYNILDIYFFVAFIRVLIFGI